MKATAILFLTVYLISLNPVSALVIIGECNANQGYENNSFFSNVPINTEKTFMGYSVAWTGNTADYQLTYHIDGNEFTPGNYQQVLKGSGGWEDICGYNNGVLVSNIHTMYFSDINPQLASFQILVNPVGQVTPTPTPTPTPTSTVVPTTNPTATPTPPGTGGSGNGTGNGMNPLATYNPGSGSDPYSHIPSNSAMTGVGKGLGFCQSGTCNANDVIGSIQLLVNPTWWVLFLLVWLRFYSLRPKKKKGKRK